MLRTSVDIMKYNGFKLTGERSRRYPGQIITDADCADYIAHLANTPTQAKNLLHGLERAAGSISLNDNADMTEYMCFNQRGDFSIRNGSSLKLVDKFTYLGSSVSSIEKDVKRQVTKAWAAVDRVSVI